MTAKKQLQFELWEECNSNCKFCYLGKNKQISDKQKLINISKVKEKISDKSIYSDIDCIGLIGGEFFQGQLRSKPVYSAFAELLKQINELFNSQLIAECWISASLLFKDQHDLFQLLAQFDPQNLSKLWILTSYDTVGRFHTDEQKSVWIDNIRQIKAYSNDIKINITSIVTGDFIEKYLDKTLDLFEIANENGCSVFLKPPSLIQGFTSKAKVNEYIPNFFPRRSDMLKFLLKYRQNATEHEYNKLFNINYRADKLITFGARYAESDRIKDQYQEKFDSYDADVNEVCKHSVQYSIYIDCEKCSICDKQMIGETYGK